MPSPMDCDVFSSVTLSNSEISRGNECGRSKRAGFLKSVKLNVGQGLAPAVDTGGSQKANEVCRFREILRQSLRMTAKQSTHHPLTTKSQKASEVCRFREILHCAAACLE